jgi:GGDEF domain-containing protein
LKFERYDESIHFAYIKALVNTNRGYKAIEHYEHVTNIFYSDLNTNVSPKLSNLYNDIQNIDKGKDKSISQIINEIDESAQEVGGFFCNYEVFKNIYRVQYLHAKRYNQSICIVVITINGKLTIQNVAKVTEKLKQRVSDCLRKSDCFSRYSINQFICILPNVVTDNVIKINKRISNAFSVYRNKYELELTFDMKVESNLCTLSKSTNLESMGLSAIKI